MPDMWAFLLQVQIYAVPNIKNAQEAWLRKDYWRVQAVTLLTLFTYQSINNLDMRLNFWSKKRAVESENNWNPNPAPKYCMSSADQESLIYLISSLLYTVIATVAVLGGNLYLLGLSAFGALFYAYRCVKGIVQIDKGKQRASEKSITMTKRADSLVYDIHKNAPHWPLEDIKHFVRNRIYP